ncbi:MAG: methyltransferase domain-containing protein, partial [Vicinamibacterales bacterium]
MSQTWSPNDYQQHAGFVSALGASILARLAPQAGERILDLGCGDGVLTETLLASGAEVVAVDGSPQMVAAAVARGIAAHVMDAR